MCNYYSAIHHAARGGHVMATSQENSVNSDRTAIRRQPSPCSMHIYVSLQLNTKRFPQPQVSSKKGVYVHDPINERNRKNMLTQVLLSKEYLAFSSMYLFIYLFWEHWDLFSFFWTVTDLVILQCHTKAGFRRSLTYRKAEEWKTTFCKCLIVYNTSVYMYW